MLLVLIGTKLRRDEIQGIRLGIKTRGCRRTNKELQGFVFTDHFSFLILNVVVIHGVSEYCLTIGLHSKLKENYFVSTNKLATWLEFNRCDFRNGI